MFMTLKFNLHNNVERGVESLNEKHPPRFADFHSICPCTVIQLWTMAISYIPSRSLGSRLGQRLEYTFFNSG